MNENKIDCALQKLAGIQERIAQGHGELSESEMAEIARDLSSVTALGLEALDGNYPTEGGKR